MLDYAIVVATRNRLEMLKISIPLFLAQSRMPSRLVIVDRSDDHEAVIRLCQTFQASTNVPIALEYGVQANSAAQRNQGLRGVRESVAMMPDDDSLWFPDTAARVMEVYEADESKLFGAVSSTEVYAPPSQPSASVPPRQARLTELPWIMRARNSVEAALFPQPFNVYGAERIKALGPGARRAGLDYPLIETIGGYRMTFRTEVAQSLQFDDLLGSRVGYAIHEDKELGLRVLASGLLMAAAPDSRVFHNAAPGRRANGYEYGFFQILNYAYACLKTFPESSRARAVTRRYLRYKVNLYSLRKRDSYARDVHRGALAAYREYDTLRSADPRGLADRYEAVCDSHLKDQG